MGTTQPSKNYIHTGVPLGSNLRPLLFLIYIDDLPNCLGNSVPALYADDNNITVTGFCNCIEGIEKKMNKELDSSHNWLLANKLSLNNSVKPSI